MNRREYEQEKERQEWQVDKNGKRFRKVGNIIEYEMELVTTCGKVREGKLKETLDGIREDQRKRYEVEKKQKEIENPIICPYKSMRGHSIVNCDREKCAVYMGEICGLRGEEAPRDTKGLKCPFSSLKCNEKCGLYNKGCTKLNRVKEIEINE